MSFTDSIKLCFAKYADFAGRAKRPEYWWFALFCMAIAVVLEFVSSPVSWAFSLATLLPSLAVGARRLHDMNKSGWMQLLWLIPVFGWIYLIYVLAQPGDAADNQHGAPPAN
ncbi:MAG: DUF805 domain-containing protein [Pseudomonadota bacterium]